MCWASQLYALTQREWWRHTGMKHSRDILLFNWEGPVPARKHQHTCRHIAANHCTGQTCDVCRCVGHPVSSAKPCEGQNLHQLKDNSSSACQLPLSCTYNCDAMPGHTLSIVPGGKHPSLCQAISACQDVTTDRHRPASWNRGPGPPSSCISPSGGALPGGSGGVVVPQVWG